MFAAENYQLLTFHQIPVKTTNPKPGWSEQVQQLGGVEAMSARPNLVGLKMLFLNSFKFR